MSPTDQQVVAQAAARALSALSLAAEDGSASAVLRSLLLEALEAVETVEALTDLSRDAFVPGVVVGYGAPRFQHGSDSVRERLAVA
ncbi:hypothetical protein ACFQX4_27710 [Roseomonas sp. GCM10028921]